MQTATLMIGIPGYGKTTIANTLVKTTNAVWLSSDDYRKRLLGSEEDQSNGSLIFNALHHDVRENLLNGNDVIVDATNVSEKARKGFIEDFSVVECKKIAYVVNTPYSDCVERDNRRDRTVGEQVIQKFMRNFSVPNIGEGFDYLIFDCMDGYDITDEENLFDKMKDFNQHNHHHAYTLDVHTKKLCEHYNKNSEEYFAALYHDVGKVFSHTEDENGEYHYPSHANISTYWICSHKQLIPDTVDFKKVIFLIQNHMRIRDIISTNSKKIIKMRKTYGDEWVDSLIEFYHNDDEATGTV